MAKAKWEGDNQLAGYIWHTTGSGKTMTSFKSAQLIASSRDADKVIFLVDRIELGTQSLKEYRGFADEKGYKPGFVMWPVRTAVSGKRMTPGGATEIMEIIGKDETVSRIKAAIEKLSK